MRLGRFAQAVAIHFVVGTPPRGVRLNGRLELDYRFFETALTGGFVAVGTDGFDGAAFEGFHALLDFLGSCLLYTYRCV